MTLKAIAWETADERPGSEMMIAYLSNDLPLVAIAEQVGYQSEAAFSKAFKR